MGITNANAWDPIMGPVWSGPGEISSFFSFLWREPYQSLLSTVTVFRQDPTIKMMMITLIYSNNDQWQQQCIYIQVS